MYECWSIYLTLLSSYVPTFMITIIYLCSERRNLPPRSKCLKLCLACQALENMFTSGSRSYSDFSSTEATQLSEDWATALVWTSSTTISCHSCLHFMLVYSFLLPLTLETGLLKFFFSANPIVHSVHDVSMNIVLSLFFFLLLVSFLGLIFTYDMKCCSGLKI